MQYHIENERMRVTVDTHGAELVSLTDKKSGRELMWQADPVYWGRTSPVLFPVVGSYYDKTMRFEGKEYHSGQHGFARDMEFSLSSQDESSFWFVLESNENTRESYPFEFKLSIGYIMKEDSLSVCWRVDNTDSGDIWFSVGGHPAFNCDLSHTKLLFGGAGSDVLVSGIIEGDGSGCLSERTKNITLTKGELILSPELFDEDALIIEDKQASSVTLINTSDGNETPVFAAKFDTPLFGIWSPVGKNAPFVCIEPWYGRCDRVGFTGDISAREYINRLGSGETFDGGYELSLL